MRIQNTAKWTTGLPCFFILTRLDCIQSHIKILFIVSYPDIYPYFCP